MAKIYYHVFARHMARNIGAWFHEASRDTRADAQDDKDSLERDAWRVKIIRSARDPLAILAELNAALKN